jgi:uncharacterized membrane protein
VVAIAWIGASFYFIWLDNHLEKAPDAKFAGELYAIHGGGFYRAQKYRVAPDALPPTLHWFKWEAYWTWLTGFALLVLVYYVNPQLYLVDPTVLKLSSGAAIGLGLASLILGLAVYEGLCRSPIARNEPAFAAVLIVFLTLLAWSLTQLFSGRGAFLHFGAILGTIMAGNVAHVIIPGQREMVRAKQEGREPDPKYAMAGKQRSVHNTYFTLPVIFAMISGHHAMTYGSGSNWLVLLALGIAGALVRVWFVARHKGSAPAWTLGAAFLLIAASAALVAPRPSGQASFADVEPVIATRCASCHADKPTFQGLAEAPKGVKLDSEERIRAQAAQIRQTVRARLMPPGNLTGLTDQERALLEQWNP